MTLEKVEKEPDIYVLPEVNERAEGVANWFKLAGDLDLKAPMEFPEGKYNVKCKMEELAECPEAMEIVAKAVKLATNFDVAPRCWHVGYDEVYGARRNGEYGRQYAARRVLGEPKCSAYQD